MSSSGAYDDIDTTSIENAINNYEKGNQQTRPIRSISERPYQRAKEELDELQRLLKERIQQDEEIDESQSKYAHIDYHTFSAISISKKPVRILYLYETKYYDISIDKYGPYIVSQKFTPDELEDQTRN